MIPSLTRKLTPSRLVLAVLGASLAAATAAPAVVGETSTLTGEVRDLPVALTYSPKTRSVNGFQVEYTCRGRKPVNDSDVYMIAADADKPLARVRSNKRLRGRLKGDISRFSEDGQRTIGSGRLVLNMRLYQSSRKRVLRGRMRVRSSRCPSARVLRVRVVGRR